MARKSNGGKSPRKQLRQESGPGQAAANTLGVALAVAAGLKEAPATGPSHKPLDYSKFESIQDESDDEVEPCFCGKRHPHGLHPGDEADIEYEHEEDEEEDEKSYASDESSSMPSMLVDPELVRNEAKRKQFEAEQKAKATAPPAGTEAVQAAKSAPAKKTAPADKATAAADKPKGLAKGFLAASAPATKTANGTSGTQARRSSSSVEDVSDEDSDGERPQAPGGSTGRQSGANGNGSAGGGGGGWVPNGNGIVDEDEDSDGPPGLTDTEEEVPRMRYSRPKNFVSAAAAPETQRSPAQHTPPGSLAQHIAAMPREAAKGPEKEQEKPKAAKAEDRGKTSLAEDEGIDAGEDSDEMDAPVPDTPPGARRVPQPYPGDGGRGGNAKEEAQRRKLEDEAKEKAWKETQKQHQAARTKHKEEAAAAAERIAAELLAEEEKNKAKKEKAAAKKKEKKAKKKKTAEPVVPQYVTAEEEAEQAKMEAAETELARLRIEADKAKEKPGPSAPQEEEAKDESNVEDLLVLAKMKLQGSDTAEQVPKGKGKGKAKAAQLQDPNPAAPQAAGKGKAPVVPVQEALAFAGVQQRPVAPPLKPAKPDAPKAGGPNNITAREITATVEAAMGSGDVTNLETAIASATSWLNHGNNRQSFKVRNLVNEAKTRLNQMKAPAPAAAAAPAPTPVQATAPRPVYNPMARNEMLMPQPATSAFPSSVQALFGAPRPAASGPGPAGPGAGPAQHFRPPPAAAAAAPPPPYRPAAAPGPGAAARPPSSAQQAVQPPLPRPSFASTPQATAAAAGAGHKEDITEDKECCVCLEHEKKMIFIPCGHLVTCKRCATMIMDTNRLCPVCRVKIQESFPMEF